MKGSHKMIKNIKKYLSAALIVPLLTLGSGAAAVLVPAAAVNALGTDNLSLQSGADSAKGNDQGGSASCLFGTEANCSGGGVFKTITNVMLFIIGAISVIMLIIGGLRYVVSGGDSSAVQNAKNTILYAIVGIVVAILAYAVVNFVISSFANNNG